MEIQTNVQQAATAARLVALEPTVFHRKGAVVGEEGEEDEEREEEVVEGAMVAVVVEGEEVPIQISIAVNEDGEGGEVGGEEIERRLARIIRVMR